MRKALLTVISFTLCLYITSCSQSSKPEKARTIETIATDAQQTLSFNHEPLSIDPIGIGDIIVTDTFLILALNKEENMLHVYNLPHLQFLGSFQKIGNGPDEVILPSAFTQWFNKDGQIQLVMRSYQKFTGLLNISKRFCQRAGCFLPESIRRMGKHCQRVRNQTLSFQPDQLGYAAIPDPGRRSAVCQWRLSLHPGCTESSRRKMGQHHCIQSRRRTDTIYPGTGRADR